MTSEEYPGQHYATHRYSVIPDRDGSVHAVLDGIVRSVFHNANWSEGLLALCGKHLHPLARLRATATLCMGCELKAKTFPGVLVRRPAPGNPLLREMARHSAETIQ